MQEKECKPINKEFITKFLMEAQNHSGLPFINYISMYFVQALTSISISDDLLDNLMNKFINVYMISSHEIYMKNKTWKSYDW